MIGGEPDWDSHDTMMLLTLDNLAKRYKCLPSEALSRADTLDLYVLDLSAKWSKYQQQQNEHGNNLAPKERLPSQAEMLAMIERVKPKERQ